MSWWTRLRVWLACLLVRRTPFCVRRAEELSLSHSVVVRARDVVLTSGHLTRAYHVGKELRKLLDKAITLNMMAAK